MVVSLSSSMFDHTPNMEWCKAQQQIVLSVDLVQAAKQQLRFLSTIDDIGCLYDGPAVERAIYRYKYCWLPLVAKHMECPIFKGPMVIPIDCEWIWHCHRLNPVQYQRDCEEIFGKMIGNENVFSTLEETSSKQTESVWKQMYENEPYHLDLDKAKILPAVVSGRDDEKNIIDYDLKAAVSRQASFYSKVSDLMNHDDTFFQASLDRYKSFLYLIKTSGGARHTFSFVPTPDIDLLWHSHQLNPIAYSADLHGIFGGILDHNDRDLQSNKLFNGFGRTKQIWEVTYGCMYSRGEGAVMSKGNTDMMMCYTACFSRNV